MNRYFIPEAQVSTPELSLTLTFESSLNEYSLKDAKTKQPVKHIFHTEKDIFDYLQYEYVEPWDRIN